MATPTRAPRAAPAQPARTDRAPALLAVAEGVDEVPEALRLVVGVALAAGAVLAPAEADCVARGAVDCPAIWERTSAEKTPVMLLRLYFQNKKMLFKWLMGYAYVNFAEKARAGNWG